MLKCYGLLDPDSETEVLTDYNCRDVFEDDGTVVAHTLLMPADGDYAVFLLANCSGGNVRARFVLRAPRFAEWIFQGLPGHPDPNAPLMLEPWQVAAAVSSPDAERARRVAAAYSLDSPPLSAAGRAFAEGIRQQRACREEPPACATCILEVEIPVRLTSHEQSLWDDLYSEVIALQETLPDGLAHTLGYVSANGLESRPPAERDRLRLGVPSRGIALHEILEPGVHRLRLHTESHGQPGNSKVVVSLTEDGRQTRRLRFCNELEDDRSMLHWTVSLRPE